MFYSIEHSQYGIMSFHEVASYGPFKYLLSNRVLKLGRFSTCWNACYHFTDGLAPGFRERCLAVELPGAYLFDEDAERPSSVKLDYAMEFMGSIMDTLHGIACSDQRKPQPRTAHRMTNSGDFFRSGYWLADGTAIMSDGRRQPLMNEYKVSGFRPALAIFVIEPSRVCRNVSDPPSGFYCSACHWGDFSEPSHLLTSSKFTGKESGGPNYCPNCGAKVVE